MFLVNRRQLNPNVTDMQRVVERMARAKWITGTNIVAPENIVLSLTRHGRDRFRRIRKSLRNHTTRACLPPKFCIYDPKSNPPMTLEERMKVDFEIEPYLRELQPPFSDGEQDSLMTLLLFYAREEKDLLSGKAASTVFKVRGFELDKPEVIDLDEYQSYMQGAVDILAKAKWIRGKSVVTATSTRVTFTAHGRKEIREIRSVFRDIDAMYAKTPSGATIAGEPGMTPDQYMQERIIEDVSHITAALKPSQWTDGQRLMILQLLWYYSRMEKDPLAKGPATVTFPLPSTTVKAGPDKKGKWWPKPGGLFGDEF